MTGVSTIDRAIGMRGYVRVSGNLEINVTVIDVRRVYGRIEYQVAPSTATGGRGAAWIRVENFHA